MNGKHRLRLESRIILNIFTLAMIPVLISTPTHTQAQTMLAHRGPVCGERNAIIDNLKTKYAERPEARGLAANGALLEVMTAQSGTWSILLTMPGGGTCLIAAGEHWQDIRQQEVDTPS